MSYTEIESCRIKLWRLTPELAVTTVKGLSKFLNIVGICLLRQNKTIQLSVLTKAILGTDKKFPTIPKEINIIINNFCKDLYKNRRGVEVISLAGANCLISKEVFENLYSLMIYKSSKNGVLKQLPLKEYTKFERELYDSILKRGPISRRALMKYHGISGKSARRSLDDALKKIWKKLWIVKIGSENYEGSVWIAASEWDKNFTRKVLKIKRTEALERIVIFIIRSSVAITRRQIKRLLKIAASSEEIDKVISSLLLRNLIKVDDSLIVNGKRALAVNNSIKNRY